MYVRGWAGHVRTSTEGYFEGRPGLSDFIAKKKCTFCNEEYIPTNNRQLRDKRCMAYWAEGKRLCKVLSDLLCAVYEGVPDIGLWLGQPPNTVRVHKRNKTYVDLPVEGMTQAQILSLMGKRIPPDLVYTRRKCRFCGRFHVFRFKGRVWLTGYTGEYLVRFTYIYNKRGPRMEPLPESIVIPDFSGDWERLGYNPYDEQPQHDG